MADNEVSMMMSVYPGAMTGFSTLMAGMASINNVFMQTMTRIDDNFGVIDSSIIATGALVSQLGMKAMDAYGQFEQGMKIVQMVSGQTAQDISFLSQKANEFSVQYRTDIDQITEGLQTLGRAGLNSASEQAEVLENGLTTAKLEGRELNSVLEELIQNTALLGGDLKSPQFGEQSQYVNDMLVATSMTAPITTHDISETLKYSGGIAHAAGADITTEDGKRILEDYLGSIAAFAQKGVTGSIAGTALRAFFNKPATQDSSVTDALASIHLKPEYLWEDDEETMKPVSTQISIIQKQMDKLDVSTMDRLQIWSKIVGGKMGQQMMKLDASSIKEITKDIQSAESAENLAAGSMKTYEANIKQAQEQGAKLERSIGKNLVQFVNPFLELANKILGFLNNDFAGFPLAMGIIGFLGAVAIRIKKVFSTIKAEIAEVWQAIRQGETVSVRQMRGNTKTGLRGSLGGLTVEGAETPEQIKKAFEVEFAKDAINRYKGWKPIDIAVAEQTKGWSAQLDGKREEYKGLNEIGKQYGFSTRHNDMIYTLAEHGKLNDEVRKVLASSGNKSAKMGTTLSTGQTVESYIVKEYFALQKKINSEMKEATKELERKEKEKSNAEKQNSVDLDENTRKRNENSSSIKNNTRQLEGEATKTHNDQQKGIHSTSPFEITRQKYLERTHGQEAIDEFVDNSINKTIDDVLKREKYSPTTAGSSFNRNINVGAIEDSIERELAEKESEAAYSKIVEAREAAEREERAAVQPFYDYYGANFSKKKGAQAFYWSNQELGLQFDPTNSAKIMNKFAEGFMNGVLPNISFEDFIDRDVLKSLKGNVPKGKLKEAYKTYMNRLQTQLDNFTLQQIKNRDINSLSAAELHKYAPTLSDGYVKGWRGPNSRTADDVRNDLRAYNAIKDLKVPTLQKMLRQYGVDIGPKGKGWTKDRSIETLLPIVAKDLRENDSLLKDRIVKENELRQSIEKCIQSFNKAADAFEKKAMENNQRLGEEREKRIRDNAVMPGTTPTSRQLPVVSSRQTPVDLEKDLEPEKNIAKEKEKILNKESDNIKQRSSAPFFVSGMPADVLKTVTGDMSRDEYWEKQTGQSKSELMMAMRGIPPQGEVKETFRNSMKESFGSAKNSIVGTFQGLGGSLKDKWNADRRGRLGFGTSSRIGRSLNGVMNLSDFVGGPLMIAITAVTSLINYVKGLYEEYATELNEAKEAVKNAYSERSQAEDALEQTYRDENEEATKEEVNDFVLSQYGDMYDSVMQNNSNFSKWIENAGAKTGLAKKYETDEEKDDGSMKEAEEEEKTYEEALGENTQALYAAVAELELANNKLIGKMQDGVWGIDGLSSAFSDELGKAQDTWLGYAEGSGSIENGFLKTASQKDENYAGYTELSGLMLEDFKDARGDWQKGMRTIFGSDYNDIVSTMTPQAKNAFHSMAQFSNSIGAAKNARLQSSMMNDKKSWQMLAKEMAKYEKQTGKHAMNVQNTENKRMENLIKKLQIDTHLNRAQVLAAAQLQQLQDMYQVAEQTFVPLMSDQATTAAQLYDTTANGISPQTGNAAGGAVSTAQNAAAIAAYLSVMAQNAAVEAAYNEDLMAGNTKAKTKEEYLQEAVGTHIEIKGTDENGAKTVGGFLGIDGDYYFGGDLDKQNKIAHSLEYQGDRIRNPEWTDQQVSDYSKRINDLINQGMSFQDAMELARKNYAGAVAPLVKQSYLASDVGEVGDDGAGNGGGGSGDGDKDKDNTGTKKERVDLVLCNKKEIPKLNVNLFKKPPSFTILNKNFKLRDVRINSEDKPKAIMAAIKNSFIDIQKRTDPKIIQDEEAVYDPNAATDGTNLPSGSAKTRTDS